jgi:nucleoside-diphosphate-sugar epimerase
MAAQANPELDRFVYVSSISAQGPGIYRDEYPGECRPVSHYGKSKLLGEKGVRGVADDLSVSIFRPPPVYGPRDTDMFALFRGAKLGVSPVYGSGQSRMSVIHIFDLADAIVESVEQEYESGAIFPIDDGKDYTWVELSEIAGKAFDKSPVTIPIPGFAFKTAAHLSEFWGRLTDQAMIFSRDKVAEMEQDSWVCGNRRLREELGWQPAWPLEERGAAQTARWYVENGWL